MSYRFHILPIWKQWITRKGLWGIRNSIILYYAHIQKRLAIYIRNIGNRKMVQLCGYDGCLFRPFFIILFPATSNAMRSIALLPLAKKRSCTTPCLSKAHPPTARSPGSSCASIGISPSLLWLSCLDPIKKGEAMLSRGNFAAPGYV